MSLAVVINADDFGLTEGVCAGIVQAIEAGGVTSTTAMVCVPGAAPRLRRWAPRIAGQIGVHLQLTSGTPILPPESVPSLVTKDGTFPARRKEIKYPKIPEIVAEWTAQIETLISIGIQPTHLDSHHHVHGLPGVFPAFRELAKRYALPVRSMSTAMTQQLQKFSIPYLDHTLTDWYGGELSVSSLVRVLEEGTREHPQARSFELMCHPGIADERLPSLSRYVGERDQELAALCSPALHRAVADAGYVLLTFSEALASSISPSAPVTD